MAAAIDWLDAYRANDLETILTMYGDTAVIECGCGESKRLTGKAALRAYWAGRLQDCPASELDHLEPAGDGATIRYFVEGEAVAVTLLFDDLRRIVSHRCGPT